MDCIACGTPDTRVKESLDDGSEVKRKRICPCGAVFFSIEVASRKTLRTPIPVPTNSHRYLPVSSRPPDMGRINPLLATGACGGEGGALSSGSDLTLFPADPAFSQLPDPDPSEETDQEVDPARARPTTAEFEAFWRAIESNRPKGSKIKAEKSWKKGGRPPASLLVTKWKAYRLSIGDSWASDVVTWLNIPGWLEDWEPAPATTVRNGHPSGHSPSPYRPIPTLPAGVPRPR